jgi:chemotaxis protein CheY-P-specific phosphatase CheC
MVETGHRVDALRELVASGASWAATALAQLAGCSLAARSPRRAPSGREAGPWEVGLFADVQGPVSGVIALLLTPHTRDSLVKTLLGSGDEDAEAAESALRELGNIVASQVVSAMASELGVRLLPSVPTLVARGAEIALAARVRRRGGEALRFETLLQDAGAGLRALLVFVADALPDSFDPDGGV